MNTRVKFIASLLLSVVCFIGMSLPAFADELSIAQQSEFDSILSSFYAIPLNDNSVNRAQTGQLSITDPNKMTEKGTIINKSSLFEMHHTIPLEQDDIISMCDDIINGEKLIDYTESMGILYGISQDENGKDNGYVEYQLNRKTNSYEMIGFGEITEISRMDLSLSTGVKNSLSRSALSLADTQATFCIINGFATGIIFNDGEQEYFMPVVDTINSIGYVEADKLYTTKAIAEIIIKNSDSIFAPNLVGENGNPAMGGGRNPDTGANNDFRNTLLAMGLIAFLGASASLTYVLKSKSARNNS